MLPFNYAIIAFDNYEEATTFVIKDNQFIGYANIGYCNNKVPAIPIISYSDFTRHFNSLTNLNPSI